MNWVGNLVQKYVDPADSVLDLGCGIMQAIMNFIPAYHDTRLQCRYLHGVDLYEPYVRYLRSKGIDASVWDLRDLPLPITGQGFDVVLLLDTLEHLENIDQAEDLINDADRIARKKVIVLTPSNFDENVEATKEVHPYEGLGDNPLQAHHILIKENWLRSHGFKTRQYEIRHGRYSYIFAVKNIKLRILHVWSQAGVSGLMARYQRRLGHQADVIKRDISYNGLGQDRFYRIRFLDDLKPRYSMIGRPGETWHLKPTPSRSRIYSLLGRIYRVYRSWQFYVTAAILARNYDIIHIHSVYPLALLLPFKKKIVEYHGEIRSNPSYPSAATKKKIQTLLLDILKKLRIPQYVSTPDLLKDMPSAGYIPNPVDTEHFDIQNPGLRNPEFSRRYAKGKALYSWNWYEDKEWAEKIAAGHGWDLQILERRNQEMVPYFRFPEFLARFEFYIDRYRIRSLSKTALEALAIGLKVVDWQGGIRSHLDPRHLPENVARKTLAIYYQQLGGSL